MLQNDKYNIYKDHVCFFLFFFSQVAEVISKKIIDKIRRSDIVICGKAESYVAVP